MSAHSPGPWTWRPIPNAEPHEHETVYEINFWHSGGGPEGRGGMAPLATCDGDNAVWLEEGAAIANAHLIAAAPDLLAALKRMVNEATRATLTDHFPKTTPLEDAVAAIARAQGRQS